MELRSFMAGMCVIFGVATLLPFVGIKVAVTTASPVLNLAMGVVAIAAAVFLLKSW